MLAPRLIGRALEQWPDADDPSYTAFMLANSMLAGRPVEEKSTFYKILAENPEKARRFAACMNFLRSEDVYSVDHAISGYDWGALPHGSTVVDLGGSYGDVSIALAKHFSKLSFIVQDLLETIDAALELPGELSDRIHFAVHNFLDHQPVRGAQVYLLRWVLHNWSDADAVKIHQALMPALSDGCTILIQDAKMPRLGSLPNAVERETRWLDMMMLALLNAGDREEAQWRSLIAKADSRSKWQGVTAMEGSALNFIEMVWEP
ncbi:Putative O-methyltransferase domain, S-adenosyl-L-methionine-dependent methyltransferase [Septoria linicola]|uniref:O-methyltransferase domain, S-adenosyl-L-methionine-dependent methyltransferase n=1 Tax=Septoria linicola TaxID=215465 RepID=A0A9Q9AN59_9PEZI|nr:Putative O-methyltransferase domain, S-adenosyl-L-methionine-dependent methyltransferase [Septoria linicola]